MTAAAPFKRKAFLAAAEAFLADKLAAWRKDYAGSPMEAAAVAYARQENWSLPTEGLDGVTVLSLFDTIDLRQIADNIEYGIMPERDAKLRIAAAVTEALRAANTAISQLHAKNAPNSLPAPARGIPEAAASSVVTLHRFTVGGLEFYTLDRALNETVRAAQVQQKALAVTWADSPLGRQALTATLTD